MIKINSHPNKSTTFNPGHKVTNQIDKICRVRPFLTVVFQFHRTAKYIKFYMIIFVL